MDSLGQHITCCSGLLSVQWIQILNIQFDLFSDCCVKKVTALQQMAFAWLFNICVHLHLICICLLAARVVTECWVILRQWNSCWHIVTTNNISTEWLSFRLKHRIGPSYASLHPKRWLGHNCYLSLGTQQPFFGVPWSNKSKLSTHSASRFENVLELETRLIFELS